MDASSKAVNYLGDDHKKAEKTKQWKKSRDAMAAAEAEKAKAAEAAEAGAEATAEAGAEAGQKAQAQAADESSALVVSNVGSTSWDRFGARLGDMPFLNSVFENPLFDRVFGETEIAASIREMKEWVGDFGDGQPVGRCRKVPIPHSSSKATNPKSINKQSPMGAASSDFVDPETLPLQILLAEEVHLDKNGKEQNGVEKKKEDNEKLLGEIWQLRHEKNYWRDYAREMEKERNDLRDAQDTAWSGPVSLKSPLTRWSEKIYRPDGESTYWKWYKTNCPCCRRPLEITMSSVKEEPWTRHPRGSRHAFVTALWGANAGYALGALVLGSRLRELSPHIERVIVHTDDVPSNYLEAFEKDGLWQLHKVDYIDGVSDLYVSKGNIFDGVFTKLAVLLLDLDIIPLKPLDELFQLPCPAAMVFKMQCCEDAVTRLG
eukprot:symbB.v1.2.018041.t2/scaffold1424.1/size119625/6